MSTLGVELSRRTARQGALLDRLVSLIAAEGFAQFTLDAFAARLNCSKTTLYALAPSRPELVVEAVKRFFQTSVTVVEARVAAESRPVERVAAYLTAVADCLSPLSRRFLEDLAAFTPAAALYEQNTALAAERIRGLIAAGIAAGDFRDVDAAFMGEMVAATMLSIQRGNVAARLRLTDSEAYAELADLVMRTLVK